MMNAAKLELGIAAAHSHCFRASTQYLTQLTMKFHTAATGQRIDQPMRSATITVQSEYTIIVAMQSPRSSSMYVPYGVAHTILARRNNISTTYHNYNFLYLLIMKTNI
eukprot:scaffold24084_cov18-Prasinocladus_malaysianus.AAC.1